MSEQNEKIETEVLTARVRVADKKTIMDFAKSSEFENVHDGFHEIAKRIHATPETITIEVPSEKNIEQVFEFESYSNFVHPTDTSIVESIQRALAFAKKQCDIPTVIVPGRVLDLTPEMEKKATLLFRFLKSKNKIPTDATEKEYYDKLFEKLLTRHIDNNFDFINKE
jgi:hypothetical protein